MKVQYYTTTYSAQTPTRLLQATLQCESCGHQWIALTLTCSGKGNAAGEKTAEDVAKAGYNSGLKLGLSLYGVLNERKGKAIACPNCGHVKSILDRAARSVSSHRRWAWFAAFPIATVAAGLVLGGGGNFLLAVLVFSLALLAVFFATVSSANALDPAWKLAQQQYTSFVKYTLDGIPIDPRNPPLL
jgi:hypothetical protein